MRTSCIRRPALRAAVLVWPDIFGLRDGFRADGQAPGGIRLRGADGESLLPREEGADLAGAADFRPRNCASDDERRSRPKAKSRDAQAFVAWLDAQKAVDTKKKIGTTGYCMGGPIVLRTAAAVPNRIGAAATFHGGGLTTKDAEQPAPADPEDRRPAT